MPFGSDTPPQAINTLRSEPARRPRILEGLRRAGRNGAAFKLAPPVRAGRIDDDPLSRYRRRTTMRHVIEQVPDHPGDHRRFVPSARSPWPTIR